VKKGQVDNAVRRALNIFDKWNDVTGALVKHSSWYYEAQACIEDAVHCGIQEALQEFKEIDGEKD
jgi:hypothetical protein